MKIDILSLFPSMFQGFLDTSILKRSIAKDVVDIAITNIRDFTEDKYGRVDDYPIGGGAGLVMKCQPIISALSQVRTPKSKVVLLSPRGQVFQQSLANELSKEEHLVFICGHYEGVDERIYSEVDLLISLGDFILTGGELAAMVVTDAIVRLLPGAITAESLLHESFQNGLLEHPQYTLPRLFQDQAIPDILLSGNHRAIAKYRLKESLRLTKLHRPDLLLNRPFTKEEKALLRELEEQDHCPKWMQQAIEKGKKFTK